MSAHSYDLAGQRVAARDELGRRTDYEYDVRGRLFQGKRPANHV